MALLEIKNLSIVVENLSGQKKILDQVSLSIAQHCIFALVGGSGSGKSTTGLAVLRLLASGLTVKSGEIYFEKRDLLKLPADQIRHVRGNQIAMVFQEPLYAFNPLLTIGQQVEEVFSSHTDYSALKRRGETMQLLDMVGIKEPLRVYQSYPHQLSGGMRQRAMIAQAIALKPKLIIADEPTSSLDVTLQARIIELFLKLRDQMGLSVVLITHDLGVVRHMADDVAVMKDGQIVEAGKAAEVLNNPQHCYTQELLTYVT